MTEAMVPDLRQLAVAFRYQLQSYLRTSRFLAMVVLVMVVGGALWAVVAYLVHVGTITQVGDASGVLASFLFFLAVIIYFSAALLGGDAISTDFGSRTGYYTLVLPIRRRILLAGRFLAAVGATVVVALIYYLFAIGADLYFNGTVPVGPLFESIAIAVLFCAAAVALAFFFSSLLKTPAFSILFTVLMLFVFFPILSGIITSFAQTEPWFALTYSAAAITEPIVSMPHRVGPSGFSPYIWEGLVIMAAYLVVFTLLSWLIYEFKEVSG